MQKTMEAKFKTAQALVSDGLTIKDACKRVKMSAPSWYKWQSKTKGKPVVDTATDVKVTRLEPKASRAFVRRSVGAADEARVPVVMMTFEQIQNMMKGR